MWIDGGPSKVPTAAHVTKGTRATGRCKVAPWHFHVTVRIALVSPPRILACSASSVSFVPIGRDGKDGEALGRVAARRNLVAMKIVRERC